MLGKPENPVCPLSYNKPYQKKSQYDTEIALPPFFFAFGELFRCMETCIP